jgi:hypothetical protein
MQQEIRICIIMWKNNEKTLLWVLTVSELWYISISNLFFNQFSLCFITENVKKKNLFSNEYSYK